MSDNIDIRNAISGVDINHGSVIVGQAGSPFYQAIDDQNPAFHLPLIANIQSGYRDRFDDPQYY